MYIGPFNDFMATITPEHINSICDDANEKVAAIMPSGLGTQIGIVSYTIAIELLGLYHKWLEQELSDQQ